MAAVNELIRIEADGSISFGNHTLEEKAKLEDFQCMGDLLKVKTYNAMTKLEKNGMFLYESVPGTSVNGFVETPEGVEFTVSGDSDVQITVGLSNETDYEIFVANESIGTMTTNFGGKLSFSTNLAGEGEVKVKVVQA